MATQTYIKQVAGNVTEGRTVETSAGAADANKIPNTNAAGVLDPTVLNAVAASAGAADVGKIPKLDAAGKLDATLMPAGIGADQLAFTTSEIIAAGDAVNIWNSAGAKARKADASNGRQAHGFASAGAASGASVTVMFEGTNSNVTGRTPGATQFLSATTPGAVTETPPTAAGQILQVLGSAVSATAYSFEPDSPITLA